MWRPVDGIEPTTSGSWTAPRCSHCQIIAVLCRVIRIGARAAVGKSAHDVVVVPKTLYYTYLSTDDSDAPFKPNIGQSSRALSRSNFPAAAPASCWGLLEATTVIKLGLRHPRKKERNNWARWCLSHDAPSLAINASKQLSGVGSMGWGLILQPEILNGFRKYSLQIFWVCWSKTLKLSPGTKLRVQNCLTHLLSKNRGL